MIGHAELHGWCDPQRFVNPAKSTISLKAPEGGASSNRSRPHRLRDAVEDRFVKGMADDLQGERQAALGEPAPLMKAALPVSLAIDVSSRSQFENSPEAGGSPCDIVAVSEVEENAMGRHATVRSSPADGQTQCRSEKAPAPRISLTAT
jgi:hypothetical protein